MQRIWNFAEKKQITLSRTTLIERTYLCTFVWGKFFQLLAKWCTKFIFVYAKWIYYSATRRTISIDNIIIMIFLPPFHSLLCSCVYVVHLLFAFHCMLVSGSRNKFTILLWKHTIWLEWKYIFCFDFTWIHSISISSLYSLNSRVCFTFSRYFWNNFFFRFSVICLLRLTLVVCTILFGLKIDAVKIYRRCFGF